MELCTSSHVINIQHRFPTASFHNRHVSLRRTLSPYLATQSRVKSELRLRKLSLRASSEETSIGNTENDAGVTFEDASSDEKTSQVEDVEPEKVTEEYATEDESVAFELLDKLDEKIDTDSIIPILLYGGGVIISIWLASAVVEAVDVIPVFPKLMQVVGIAYTLWFTSRYLIFKDSRDELYTKIAELKLKILGSDWN